MTVHRTSTSPTSAHHRSASRTSVQPVAELPAAACDNRPVRVIARLDIKAPHLVKGVRLEGLRIVGDPVEQARRYHEQGIDELLFIDTVATLYGRCQIAELVEAVARELFVPLTVGGGVRTLADIEALLRAGADRVAINTAAIRHPGFVHAAARAFGAQCIVVLVEASRSSASIARAGTAPGDVPGRAPGAGGAAGVRWLAFTDNGREPTGLDACTWAAQAVAQGAGELLLSSIDYDGTRRGFDLDWIARVCAQVDVPVVAAGGAGSPAHLVAAARAGASGVAVASLLHHSEATVPDLHAALREAGHEVRA